MFGSDLGLFLVSSLVFFVVLLKEVRARCPGYSYIQEHHEHAGGLVCVPPYVRYPVTMDENMVSHC